MPNSICENFIKIYFKFANITNLIYHCQQESTTLRISYLQILLKYILNLQISLSSLTAKQQNPYLKRISTLLKRLLKRKSEFTYLCIRKSLLVTKFRKYKSQDPNVYLSCSKNCYTEADFGILEFVLLKLFYLYSRHGK